MQTFTTRAADKTALYGCTDYVHSANRGTNQFSVIFDMPFDMLLDTSKNRGQARGSHLTGDSRGRVRSGTVSALCLQPNVI